jgi:hypothetical protein
VAAELDHRRLVACDRLGLGREIGPVEDQLHVIVFDPDPDRVMGLDQFAVTGVDRGCRHDRRVHAGVLLDEMPKTVDLTASVPRHGPA